MGAVRAAFDAAKHPRGAHGKFASGGDGGRVHMTGRGRARVLKATVVSDRERRLKGAATLEHNAKLEKLIGTMNRQKSGLQKPISLREAGAVFAETVNRKRAGRRKGKPVLRITSPNQWATAKPGYFRKK